MQTYEKASFSKQLTQTCIEIATYFKGNPDQLEIPNCHLQPLACPKAILSSMEFVKSTQCLATRWTSFAVQLQDQYLSHYASPTAQGLLDDRDFRSQLLSDKSWQRHTGITGMPDHHGWFRKGHECNIPNLRSQNEHTKVRLVGANLPCSLLKKTLCSCLLNWVTYNKTNTYREQILNAIPQRWLNATFHRGQILNANLEHNMQILNANLYREQILNANSWTNTYREQILNAIPQRWLNATFYREQILNANLEHNMQILNANRYREFQLSGSGIICKVVLV